MRKFILIASALVCFSCTFLKFVPDMDELDIGDKIYCKLFIRYKDDYYLNGSRWYYTNVDGIEFRFLVSSDTVSIIHTCDSSFISPEGISTETTLYELKKRKINTLIFIEPFDKYTILPSGWMACFGPGDIVDSTRVNYFMKKYYAYDYKTKIGYYYDAEKRKWILRE